MGRTPMFVAVDGREAGIVAVADTVRPESKEAIATMHALGLRVVMMDRRQPTNGRGCCLASRRRCRLR
jgi:Cu+-exporting ATPase